jgi:hypothetical protein
MVDDGDPGCRPSPEDPSDPVGLPAYGIPDVIARFRPWSKITSANDMLNTGVNDQFGDHTVLPFPLDARDTEIRIPINETGCDTPHS